MKEKKIAVSLQDAAIHWLSGAYSDEQFFTVFYGDPRVRTIAMDNIRKNASPNVFLEDLIQHGASVLLESKNKINNPEGIYSFWYSIAHYSVLSLRKKHPSNEISDSEIEGGRDDKQFGLYGSRLSNDSSSVFYEYVEDGPESDSFYDLETRKSRDKLLRLNAIKLPHKTVIKPTDNHSSKNKRLRNIAENHKQAKELQSIRKKTKLSVNDFAELVGVDPARMSDYLRGAAVASDDLMQEIRLYKRGYL